MRSLIFFIGIALLSSCSLTPCGFNKDQFISNHQELVAQAKKNKKKWDSNEWSIADDRMKKMVEECYESYEEELTSKDVRIFWAGTTKYYFNRFGTGFLNKLTDEEDSLSKALEKGIKSIDKNKEGFFEDLIKENFGDDIKSTLNEVGDELEKLKGELEQWLEE